MLPFKSAKCGKNEGAVSIIYQRSLGHYVYKDRAILTKRIQNAKSLFYKDLKGHFGCVNAIEFSNDGGQWIASGKHHSIAVDLVQLLLPVRFAVPIMLSIFTGGDDMRILLWNTEKAMDDLCTPVCFKGLHHSNIFSIAFNAKSDKIISGGKLFQSNIQLVC